MLLISTFRSLSSAICIKYKQEYIFIFVRMYVWKNARMYGRMYARIYMRIYILIFFFFLYNVSLVYHFSSALLLNIISLDPFVFTFNFPSLFCF